MLAPLLFGALLHSDLDGDGWQDLLIASDFMTSMLFWNNGDGTFSESSDRSGLGLEENGMGATIADFGTAAKCVRVCVCLRHGRICRLFG